MDRQVFSETDVDDSKSMTLVEFEALVPKLAADYGVSSDDSAGAFGKIDANGSGTITFDEFSHWVLLQGIGKGAEDELAAPLPPSMQQSEWRVDGKRKAGAAPPERPLGSLPKPKAILPKAAISFKNLATIEPVPPTPDTPFKQYLESIKRLAAAQQAS